MNNAILKVKNVEKHFGGLAAVNRVSFSVFPGEIVALIGPNGSGKTTLFNLITGILPVTRGDIWFKGHKISAMAPHKIAHLGIGRTFQDIQLCDNLTILENVMVGCHKWSRANIFEVALQFPWARREENEIRSRALSKLELVNMADRINYKPPELSLGLRRIASIARALAVEPELILLDEPAGALSPAAEREVIKQITKLRDSKVTVLIVEHRMHIVMNIADRVIVMNHGSKVAEGPPDAIQNNTEVISAYLGEEIPNIPLQSENKKEEEAS